MENKMYLALIIIGAPGSGKGTNATAIINKYNIAHISTGDILRDNVSNNTELGKKANDYMQKGALVPDELIICMVEQRINKSDCENGFLLDGFPRTIEQANALDKLLDSKAKSIDKVINLVVSEDELMGRLLKRGRADDNEETISNRLSVFTNQTSPVIEYYSKANKIINIDAVGDIEKISDDILNSI